MATERVSENLINICIVPQRLRWPVPSSATVWTSAHHCVDALKDLVRAVDHDCLQVEQNREFSADAIRQRRAEICGHATTKLTSFKAFHIAEKALVDNIDSLARLSDPDPQQAQMHDKLNQAREDLQEGVEATKRLVRERCKIG